MIDSELIRKCKEHLNQWEISTPKQKQMYMKELEKLKLENLKKLGSAINKAKIINTLIAVLNSRSVNDVEPIPEVYLKAFEELKE